MRHARDKRQACVSRTKCKFRKEVLSYRFEEVSRRT